MQRRQLHSNHGNFAGDEHEKLACVLGNVFMQGDSQSNADSFAVGSDGDGC